MTELNQASSTLKPARELADLPRRFPGESAEYRRARNELLAEEIELRRHIERVAAQRRALPLGGAVPEDYRFEGELGPVTLSEMFGTHDTLVTYNWMFGPQRERPCPMCTSLLSAYDGEMPDILQRVAFAVIARSPIEKLAAFKKERGWRYLRLYSSAGNTFNRDYAGEDPDGDDVPAFNVFTRNNGTVRHFWAAENGSVDRRPWPGPARRARRNADLDRARYDARRQGQRLVSEAAIRQCTALARRAARAISWLRRLPDFARARLADSLTRRPNAWAD
ncbi:putative dithiol-disulfide oxidoreductase (DUF899 family) [Burkholderia sp. OAS925]